MKILIKKAIDDSEYSTQFLSQYFFNKKSYLSNAINNNNGSVLSYEEKKQVCDFLGYEVDDIDFDKDRNSFYRFNKKRMPPTALNNPGNLENLENGRKGKSNRWKNKKETGKKVTENEYKTIVEIADKYIDEYALISTSKAFCLNKIWKDCLDSIGDSRCWKIEQELLAIALPQSREWAHENFVEKEKYYKWRLKNKKDSDGDSVFITRSDFDVIRTGSFTNNQIKNGVVKFFTESEIREWGYNPEMFDREEVE